MRKIALLFVVTVLSVTGIFAQFELKGLVGTNFSTLTKPAEGSDVKANAGFQFGAGVLIGDKFYVEPGIQFVRNSKTFSVENVTEDITFSQNFVKIPVYAGYHLLGHESGPVALRIFAGPAVSVAGKIKKGEDQIDKEDIKNALWLADVGVGVDILFLFVELNYEYSFNKYWTDDALDSSHTGFLINAGIHIDF
jgi:hypothetical protein